ncbi:MAG: glutamine--fructose-6-phosphate transaminase (isomerizing), partial [Verrucomicrobia bacterium]|nr:glutamine--fructose-6-phosphate transaminase (isomerizing) [Verrucomicrobiota bacterium]
MCGIFGYIGEDDPLQTCLLGLEQLEYRGYDSTGIAGLVDGQIAICKEVGKLSQLKAKLTLQRLTIAIGHTRWATHGKVTPVNAHPHQDVQEAIALVHNGIIENYEELKEELHTQGVRFQTETDTEVLTNLIAKCYTGDLVQAVQKALLRVRGHFAFALVHKHHPQEIIAAARECPLSIGVNDAHTESIISSDPNAFLGKTLNVLFLRSGEIAKVEKGKVSVFDSQLRSLAKKTERLDAGTAAPSKEGFEHFMLKEIYEQPSTVQKAYLGRLEEGEVQFESLSEEFRTPSQICFIACGTSAHAGAIGALLVEDFAAIPSHYEIASEARYRILPQNTLIVAISQSGETADTLAAVREMKARGYKVLGICNVKNSTLTRETDACIFLKAGPEVSVCSTKAFTSQITVLYLFAQFLSGKRVSEDLKNVPAQIEKVLECAPRIQQIAKKYSRFNNFFFLGRRYMFPTCMEAALKLKEISYVNANGYAAGELKHGPIALLDPHFPVIAFCANHQTEEKIVSNVQEVKARSAPILALAPESLKGIAKIVDDVIWLPNTSDALAPFASTVAGQLFAYFVAKE